MNKKIHSQRDDRYIRINSFYTACFLFSKGVALVNITSIENSNRSQFVFTNSPDVERLVTSFNFAKDSDPVVLVDVRKFVMSIKMLKDKLYQSKF